MRRQGAILPPVRIESKVYKKLFEFYTSFLKDYKAPVKDADYGDYENPGYTDIFKFLSNRFKEAQNKFFEDFNADAPDELSQIIDFSLDNDKVFQGRVDGIHKEYLDLSMEKIADGDSELRKRFAQRMNEWVSGGSDPSQWGDLIEQTQSEAGTFSKFFARDQFSRFNKSLTIASYKQGGADFVKWLTSNDGRVRQDHKALQKKIFKIDQLPPQKQDYLCRCALVPVYEEVKYEGEIYGTPYYREV